MKFGTKLEAEAAKAGIRLPAGAAEKFERYRELIAEYSTKFNLTSINDDDGILYRHFLDSLTAVPHITRLDAKCIDIGSGAGFPLVPVKLVLESLKIMLVDASGKKVDFLRALVKELRLKDVECVQGRAEELAHEKAFRSSYDYVLARAVAPLNILSEYCVPFLRKGGSLLAMKGRAAEEIAACADAIKALGAEIAQAEEFDMEYAGELNKRTIVVIRKIYDTPQQFPRRQAAITKRPL